MTFVSASIAASGGEIYKLHGPDYDFEQNIETYKPAHPSKCAGRLHICQSHFPCYFRVKLREAVVIVE